MKTNTRSVPLDMLSVRSGGSNFIIHTHRNEIWIRVASEDPHPAKDLPGGRNHTDAMNDLDHQINPCPFCGTATKEVFFADDGYSFVKCRGCGASGPECHFSDGQSRRRCIALWNRAVCHKEHSPLSPPSTSLKEAAMPHCEAKKGV